ncbi:hypothetical protein AYK21_03620 [Thermoplasmatales archaeon SG8-52-2]|nr:MAG: hypothetical protein AYK21_03620 [Thermoplasmatales archaeon SG8-52-2]
MTGHSNILVKTLVICILILLICMNITQSVAIDGSINPTLSGNILYVGGSGEGNYSKIQDAIGDANDGDTVFVYDDSSPYYEKVMVDKSINLIGENRITTKINGYEFDIVIDIIVDGVSISCFTILNCRESQDGAIIKIRANSVTINENTIRNSNEKGIIFSGVNNITISNNIFMDNHYQNIEINNSNNIRIMNNTFYGSINDCIYCVYTNKLVIVGNVFFNSLELAGLDIYLGESSNCLIKRNIFESPNTGIFLLNCKKCNFTENNFMYEFQYLGFGIVYIYPNNPINNKHKFDNNYWANPRTLPKIIVGNYAFSYFGWFYRLIITWGLLIIPIFHFDWQPAKEPYYIEI